MVMQQAMEEADEALLRTVTKGVSGSLNCTVCQELMFVPFILSCGHTFCYSCLREWFKSRPDCPLCRHKVGRPPTLNIIVRELLNGMITYLGTDSIVTAKSEADKVYEEDVKEHNLFERVFNNLIETTLDRSDGVPRCSRCLWEAHGSSCLNCGATFIDDRQSDEGEDLYFSDFDMEERASEDEDDEGSDGSSFLDNRDINAIEDDLYDPFPELQDDDEDGTPENESHWHGFSDSDGYLSLEDDEDDVQELQSAVRRVKEDVDSSDSEESSDHLETRRNKRAARVIVSDDEDEDDADL